MSRTTPILDHVQDTGGVELKRFSLIHDFPEYVKKADLNETLRPTDLPLNVYADPRPGMRVYPCHTPASTYLSSIYFAEKRSEYRPNDAARVQQRLDHYIDYWAIRGDVDAAVTKQASLKKTSDDHLPDSDFAIVWVNDETGEKIRNCRMKSAAEVKAAADWLLTYRDDLPWADRNTIARKIVEKAAAYGAAIPQPEQIDRIAGRGICEPEEVGRLIDYRVSIAKTAEVREGMQKLAQQVKTRPRAALNIDTLQKLAATLDTFDRANNLVDYTELFPRPEDFLFKVSLEEIKTASGNACGLVTGRVYNREDFKKIALADVQSLFGTEVKEAVADGLNVDAEKLAEIATTMPRPDAENFERLLDDAGIPPIHKVASAPQWDPATASAY